jgi:predicted O-linked N-acetylglucosamine transferase (SPINDLY family)
LLVFARKPAPVQVTMLGMPATTGLAAIDYRVTDPYLDPPGTSEADYTEHCLRLLHCFWCYEPPEGGPTVGELPAAKRGFVTFGCLNDFAKASRPALELWMELLRRIPDARLVLQARAGSHQFATRSLFREAGIAGERVEYIPRAPRLQYLERYRDLDLTLDPFPYNGHTSSLDSLWMGVPVITLAGRTAVGRAGTSILSNLGMTELIALTPQQYIDLAVAWASDRARLSAVRASLRERMRMSPLMDGPQYTADVEAAFRLIWKKWCAG